MGRRLRQNSISHLLNYANFNELDMFIALSRQENQPYKQFTFTDCGYRFILVEICHFTLSFLKKKTK